MKHRTKKKVKGMLIVPNYTGKVFSMRRKTGLNQQQFWGQVGVTQSGGSRYEHGRKVPPSVNIALHIGYASAPVGLLLAMRPKSSQAVHKLTGQVWYPN